MIHLVVAIFAALVALGNAAVCVFGDWTLLNPIAVFPSAFVAVLAYCEERAA